MSKRLTYILGGIAAVILISAGTLYYLTRPRPELTVATWAGPYSRAQANGMFHPFGDARRVDVRIALYDGGLDELRQMVGNHRYDWDVVGLELPDPAAAS